MKKWVALLCLLTLLPMGALAQRIRVDAGCDSFAVELADNAAASALAERLSRGSLTLWLDGYGGFEAFGTLPGGLPAEDRTVEAGPGDVMLYSGSSIVFFYGSNTWSYTPLGHVVGLSAGALRGIFGSGGLEVTLSIE